MPGRCAEAMVHQRGRHVHGPDRLPDAARGAWRPCRSPPGSIVRLDDLHDAVGKRIAELLGCQAALVTAGCASALSLATAACVAGERPGRIRRLPDTDRHEERGPRPEDAPRRLRPRDPQRGRADDRGRDPGGAREGDQRADRDDVLPQLRPTRGGRSITRSSSRSARSTTSRR